MKHSTQKQTFTLALALFAVFNLVGCENQDTNAKQVTPGSGTGVVSQPVTGVTPSPTPVTGGTTSSGYPSCVSSDPNHLCIGLKVVAYTKSGVSTITETESVNMVKGLNTVWATCNIGFQLETYIATDPSAYGLNYDSDWENDAYDVRGAFAESSKMLIVAVGSLTGSTIAVTAMPGGGPYGMLVEKSYSKNAYTVGHELGHYLGLYHINDTSNLMNPYIGTNTSAISSSQCTTARNTQSRYWMQMLR